MRAAALPLCAVVIAAALVALRDDGSEPGRGGSDTLVSLEPGEEIRDSEEDQAFPEPDSSAARSSGGFEARHFPGL